MHPSPARPLQGLPSPLQRELASDSEPPLVVAALNAYRSEQPAPYQSHFRVLALAIYEDSRGEVGCVVGANNESCTLANSLCGERAALAQLRLLPNQPVALLRMYVVTDDSKPLFPGMLCRYVRGPWRGSKNMPLRLTDDRSTHPAAPSHTHAPRQRVPLLGRRPRRLHHRRGRQGRGHPHLHPGEALPLPVHLPTCTCVHGLTPHRLIPSI